MPVKVLEGDWVVIEFIDEHVMMEPISPGIKHVDRSIIQRFINSIREFGVKKTRGHSLRNTLAGRFITSPKLLDIIEKVSWLHCYAGRGRMGGYHTEIDIRI